MVAGAIPVSALDGDRSWPDGVPAQTHATLGDPWREQEEIDQAVSDIQAGGGRIEVFDYPGVGHLFNDPTLPDEYDPEATEIFWGRALPFIRSVG
jgi:dienelactone hydrolase